MQANTIRVYCYAVDDESLKALEEISQSKIVDVYQAIGFHTDDNIDFHISYKKPFLTLRATLPDASSIVVEPQAHMTDGDGLCITKCRQIPIHVRRTNGSSALIPHNGK